MIQDVEGAINPIIQAMMATARGQQETADRAQRAEALKQETAYRQATLKHQEAQLEETTAQHKREAELQTRKFEEYELPLLKSMLAKSQLDTLEGRLKATGQGVDLNQALAPGAAPNAGLPDVQTLLENEANRVRQTAAAQSGGARAGAEPYDVAAAERNRVTESEKLKQMHQNAMELNQQQGANNIATAKVHGEYQLAGDRLNGVNHLKGIILGMGGDVAGGERANQLLNSIYSGQTNYKDLPALDKKIVDGYTAGTGEIVPTNGKDYKAALDRAAAMQELLTRARDLANNYSRDSPGGGGAGNQNITLPLIGTIHRTQPGSDLDSKMNDFKAFGGKLVTELEGMRRSGDADILRQSLGAFDPKATKQQNLDKINSRVSSMQRVLKSDVAGLPTDRVNKALGDMGITDFGAPTKTYAHEAVNPQTGHEIGSNDGKTWFDKSTGQKVVQ